MAGLFLTGCVSEAPRFASVESAPTVEPPPPVVVAPPKPEQPERPKPAGFNWAGFSGTWVPFERWCRSNGLPPLQRNSSTPAGFVLSSRRGALQLSVGSQSAHWNGIELRLGFAPQMIDSQFFVHQLDVRKTVEPLLSERQGLNASNRSLVIDPGHGGTDSGTHSALDGALEKEFTLDWALRLGAALSARGWRVAFTRTNDVNVPLADRVEFAAQRHASLFVSLHFNSAGGDSNQSGLETYCLTPTGMPSSINRGFGDELSAVFPNNASDPTNLSLACEIHESILKVGGMQDRGVRRARFMSVLRNQARPAILVEGGYLSNSREAALIATPEYRQKLAEAVAAGLEQFSKGSQPSANSPSGSGPGGEPGSLAAH